MTTESNGAGGKNPNMARMPSLRRGDHLVEGVDDRSAYKKYKDAAFAVSGKVTVLSLIGVGLILISLYMTLYLKEEYHILPEVIAHLGGAFLVSAIVGFALEWGGEVRDAREMTAILVGELYRFRREILGAATRESVRNGMASLMDNAAVGLEKQFPQLGEYIGSLKDGGWAGEACIEYLVAFQSQLTARAAELAKLTSGGALAPTVDVHIDLPDTITLVDILVENLMRKLLEENAADAEYVAVSDISTWTKLHRFADLQEEAVGRVAMRRVFVLGLNSDQQLPMDRVREILDKHAEKVENSKYEMRLLMLGDYPKRDLVELAEAKHFGIFKPGSAGQAIALVARDDGVSKLRLREAQKEMREEFERIWKRAEPVTSVKVERSETRDRKVVINDFLMAYFVERMEGRGSYYGISYTSDWIKEDYREFFKVFVAKLLANERMKARRVFVINEDDPDGYRKDLIDQHEELSRATGRKYRYCLVHEQISGDLAGMIPLGLHKIYADEPHRVVIDLARHNSDFRDISDNKKRHLVGLFEALWKASTKSGL